MKTKVILFAATAYVLLFTMAEVLYFSLEIRTFFAITSLLDNIRKPFLLFLYQPLYIFTASKRSLRRLCFLQVSVCPQGRGVYKQIRHTPRSDTPPKVRHPPRSDTSLRSDTPQDYVHPRD